MTFGAVALAAIVTIALAVGAGSRTGSPDSRAMSNQPPVWIIAGDDLSALRRSNAGLARRFFDDPHTFVVGEPDGRQNLVPSGYRSTAALSYASLARFRRDLERGRIAPSVGAVIYDPERWVRTPPSERRAPLGAMHRFTRMANRWGYGAIVAPARDLALDGRGICRKRRGEVLDSAYLRCGLTRGAAGAEAFVIQAAADELDPVALRRLLAGARAQMGVGRSDASTLATLSTSPPDASEPVWPIDLVRAAQLDLKLTGGIMLNFTARTTPLAASFLRDLERRGGNQASLSTLSPGDRKP